MSNSLSAPKDNLKHPEMHKQPLLKRPRVLTKQEQEENARKEKIENFHKRTQLEKEEHYEIDSQDNLREEDTGIQWFPKINFFRNNTSRKIERSPSLLNRDHKRKLDRSEIVEDLSHSNQTTAEDNQNDAPSRQEKRDVAKETHKKPVDHGWSLTRTHASSKKVGRDATNKKEASLAGKFKQFVEIVEKDKEKEEARLKNSLSKFTDIAAKKSAGLSNQNHTENDQKARKSVQENKEVAEDKLEKGDSVKQTPDKEADSFSRPNKANSDTFEANKEDNQEEKSILFDESPQEKKRLKEREEAEESAKTEELTKKITEKLPDELVNADKDGETVEQIKEIVKKEDKGDLNEDEFTDKIAKAVGAAIKAAHENTPQQPTIVKTEPQVIVQEKQPTVYVMGEDGNKKEEDNQRRTDSILSAIFEGEKEEKEKEYSRPKSNLFEVNKQAQKEANKPKKKSGGGFFSFGGGNKREEEEAQVEQQKGTDKSTNSDGNQTSSDLEKIKNKGRQLKNPGVISIGAILKDVVEKALDHKASDIHIEPKEDHILIRYRIDGILMDVDSLDKDLEKALIFKTKVSAKLRTDEHFAPQDGRIVFDIDNEPLNTRISILPTAAGEKIVIRLLTQRGRSFKLQDLGFRKDELATIRKNYLKPYGTIIAAGPTGSGKTTTLYAILQKINSRDINITTVEDPVEYELDGVNHVQINTKAGLSFERGLRSILRQDPDVLMIGEIRDHETAEIAINAAMTGHLVLSTIHTNDSITTVPRLIDMGVEPFLVASALNMVVAQRLSRRLCDNCKQKYTLTENDLNDLNKVRPDLVSLLKPGEVIYKEQGCDECNGTGFSGRVGLYELFEVTQEIRKIILEDADSDAIFKLARQNGMNLIIEDGVKKLREGLVSISELLRVTALKQ